MAKYRPVCYCSSYTFPHRASGGKCIAGEGEELCQGCGQPAETKEMDFGIGSYEFWGACGVDTDVQTVTVCCEANLVPNTQREHDTHKWRVFK